MLKQFHFADFQQYPIALAMLIKTRFKLQRALDFGGRYIYHDSRENTEYNRICSQHIDITVRRYIIKMAAIFISYLFAIVGPLKAYFIDGIKSTTIEARIPFCETKSNAEFMGNFLLQTGLASHGIFAYIGMEVYLSLFENVVSITPQLIEIELVNTMQLYEDGSLSEVELHWRIKRIVKLSQDANK